MIDNPLLLGELQQKILRHFFECKEKNESVSHISRELDTLQPAVFRSIKSLINDGYLTKGEGYRGGEKPINLTPKGAAAATLLGTTYKQFESRINKNSNSSLSDLQIFLNSIRAPGKQDFLFKKLMDFFLERNLSKIESDATTSGVSLVTEFLTEIAPEISAEVATIFDGTHNVKEFVDRYNLDKGLLKNILQERRQNIDSLINQLQENDELRSQSSGYKVVDIFNFNRTKPFQHMDDRVAQAKGTLNDLQYEKELVEKRDEEEEEKNVDLLPELETPEPKSMKVFIDGKKIKSLIHLWNMYKKESGPKRLKLEIQNSKVHNVSVESPSTRAA